MAKRVLFGTTWWGKAWMQALTHLDYANRLPRGRTYYNTGRIDELTFNPDTLTVNAVVQGSAYAPYEVSIRLKPLPKSDVDRLVDAVAEKPALVAKLLEGELDKEVGEIAESLGIRLFPTSWREFTMHCSCPDSAVPCKHLAAVYYAMVKTIDGDPMWVFYCRGVDLPELLRARGIDLDKAVALTEPGVLEWTGMDDGDSDEDADGNASSKWVPDADGLPPLQDIDGGYPNRLGALLPVNFEGKKPLMRNRVVKLLNGLKSDVAGLEAALKKSGDGWLKYQASFQGGQVVPDLVWTDGRYQFHLKTMRGRKIIASARERAGMMTALALTDAAHAEAVPGLSPWRFVMRATLKLVGLGALVPVLVHTSREDREKAEVLWVPAIQSPVVMDYVRRVTKLMSETGFDPLTPVLEVAGDEKPSTVLGRTFTLLAFTATALIDAFDHTPATFADEPLCTLLTQPGRSTMDYGIVQADITLLRRFLRPLSLGLMPLSWMPVMTVRTGREKNVTMNLGVLPRHAKAKARPVLLRDLLKDAQYENDRLAILSVFEALTTYCRRLKTVIETKGKPASLPTEELRDFLFEAVPSLELLGARVMLPKSLEKLLKPTLSVSLTGSGGGAKGVITKEAVGAFDWKASIGGVEISKEEFDALMARAGEIIPFNEEFVYLDPELLKRMKAQIDYMESASYLDLMKAAMTGELDDGCVVSVPDDLLVRMKELTDVTDIPLPQGLQATLRPYQQRGYAWLMKNLTLGIGALIADDMGLGKTLQVITTLLALKERGEYEKGKVIAVVPATLITNWVREIARFAPSLTVGVYHGAKRRLEPLALRPDVTLTTYGTLRRDAVNLGREPWRLLVLDEAQAVKNTGSAVTQAVRAFPAEQVLAMSGTPVENRLAEYWSLLSIVQPGILGTPEEFRDAFAKPIESDRDERALEAFRRVTGPFMLRRLKTDKSIISDLPDKVVCNRYVDLRPEQAALYASTLDYWMKKMEALEPDEAKSKKMGTLLQLITALKQICNSPSLYEKREVQMPDSGKGDALLELIDECREAGRKMLIFTQYAEMGERLQNWLEAATGKRPDFLHGGVSVKGRAEMVDRFQTDPEVDILLISLKAGGTGLNLTAASVVIHYDLWWNPAVENQATDRAFRIGQRRDVLVYRFLSAGTFEERINDMLEQKRELADLTVATGENWIGNLGTDELKALFRLDAQGENLSQDD